MENRPTYITFTRESHLEDSKGIKRRVASLDRLHGKVTLVADPQTDPPSPDLVESVSLPYGTGFPRILASKGIKVLP